MRASPDKEITSLKVESLQSENKFMFAASENKTQHSSVVERLLLVTPSRCGFHGGNNASNLWPVLHKRL